MVTIFLLAFVTAAYAGYNLFIKLATGHVPAGTTSTVLATMTMQAMTLIASLVFFGALKLQGGHVFTLPPRAFLWATVAGISIGTAEIAYYYLFSGIGQTRSIEANVAVPFIVGGTIAVVALASIFLLKEPFGWPQVLGTLLIIGGIALTFLRGY